MPNEELELAFRRLVMARDLLEQQRSSLLGAVRLAVSRKSQNNS